MTENLIAWLTWSAEFVSTDFFYRRLYGLPVRGFMFNSKKVHIYTVSHHRIPTFVIRRPDNCKFKGWFGI